jgi:hypothetical protein
VLGNKGLASLPWAVEVTLRDDAVLVGLWREEIRCKAVLLDHLLLDDPEDFCPDFADGMNAPIARLVEGFVRRGVNGEVLERMISV